ncbi:MAG: carotenoid 1,2-hydratase, partial [Leptospiraceae bacterium]|nr:carotenoid 1,2-hydratase [Leptospiraceae bacterium]
MKSFFSFFVFCYITFNLPIFSIDFPKDHSFHPNFKVEWCYFVGNLTARDGTKISYELSFFKDNLKDKEEIFHAHFALSFPDEKKHLTAQGLERKIGQLAGYTKNKIWSGDYHLEILSEKKFRIIAKPREKDFSLDLTLSINNKDDILLQGKNAYSPKSRKFPVFSYYYSIPRLQTVGTIKVSSKPYEINSGTTWMDHEWSEEQNSKSSLASKENSWDWVCLNLEDGSDIMAFNFRNSSKEKSETFGTYRNKKGEVFYYLNEGEIEFIPGKKIWKSSITKKKYILDWELKTKDFQIHFQD